MTIHDAKWLATVVVSVVVLVMTGWFYWWQYRLARQKLRHDLYDRRFAIYTTFRELLLAIAFKSDDEIKAHFQSASIVCLEAPFLLDNSKIQTVLEDIVAAAKEVVGDINYRDAIGQSGAMSMNDPEINREVVERATRLSNARPAVPERYLRELAQQFAKFLKLTDFWN